MTFTFLARSLVASAISLSMVVDAVAQSVEAAPPAAVSVTVAPAAAPLAAPAGPSADQQWQQELALWQAASSGNTAGEYNAYLQAYPAGKFSDIARSRVAALTPVPPPAAPVQTHAVVAPPPAFSVGTPMTEDALLDRGTRREVQGRLTSIGFKTGGNDGVFGDNTRTALSRWQAAIGAPVTGYFSYDQFQRLRQDSQGVYEAWLNAQRPAKRAVARQSGPVLEGRVEKNNDDGAAAALALGLIGGALLGGAIAGGSGHHHGGGHFRPGPMRGGPGRCPPGAPCR